MNNSLQDRIGNAVIKMKDAKEAYDRIDIFDKESDDYKREYTIFQGVYSAIDILLGCFVEEKSIPVYKIDKEKVGGSNNG